MVVNTFLKAHLAKVEAREYRYFLAVTCKVMSIELDNGGLVPSLEKYSPAHYSFDRENRCCTRPSVGRWRSCWDCVCDEKALPYSDYTDAVLHSLDKLRQLQIEEAYKWERVMELEKESARYNFPLCQLCKDQDQYMYFSCDEASESDYFSEEELDMNMSTPFRPEPLGLNVGISISPTDCNNNASSRVLSTRKLDLNTPSK